VEGLAQGLKSREAPSLAWQAEKNLLLKACFQHPVSNVRKASLQLLKVTDIPESSAVEAAMKQARQIAANTALPEEERAQAIQFLSLKNTAPHSSFLEELITPGEPLPVQLAALEALSAIPGLAVSQYVLKRWPSLTPEMRDQAINTFMSDPGRIKLLLDGIETGQIQQNSLGWPQSVRLMAHADENLRKRARVLLTRKDDQRQAVIRQYQTALELKGNAEGGKMVFQRNCMACHQMGGKGVAFGPDLSSIKNRRPASIMNDILDPNLSIADGYDTWTVELHSGEALQGIISAETPTALTLRNATGQESTIARKDIQVLKALGLSAMPAGLEKQINQQEMADLLAYIRQAK
jgi:putative heme-binding domain-containing protein